MNEAQDMGKPTIKVGLLVFCAFFVTHEQQYRKSRPDVSMDKKFIFIHKIFADTTIKCFTLEKIL